MHFQSIVFLLLSWSLLPTLTEAQTSLEWPTVSSNFLEMESYYNSINKKVILYFFEGNSGVTYKDLIVRHANHNRRNVYSVYIISGFGPGIKTHLTLTKCADFGFMVDFDAPDFQPDRDLIIYETPTGPRRLINFLGGSKEAESRKLKP